MLNLTKCEAILTTCDNLWQSLITCVKSWQCVTMCDNMWQNVTKIKGLNPFTVTKCHKTSDRSDMKCQNMSENVRIWHKLSAFISICHNLTQPVTIVAYAGLLQVNCDRCMIIYCIQLIRNKFVIIKKYFLYAGAMHFFLFS